MRDPKIPTNSGDEVDAFTWKKYLDWRAGERARIKRAYRRRSRRHRLKSLALELD